MDEAAGLMEFGSSFVAASTQVLFSVSEELVNSSAVAACKEEVVNSCPPFVVMNIAPGSDSELTLIVTGSLSINSVLMDILSRISLIVLLLSS